MTWKLTADGIYSARSAYHAQFFGSTDSIFPTKVWKVWAPTKCKFFMWLVLQDRVWTAARLQQRGWPNEYFCQLCHRNLETVDHLFIECPFVRQVWENIATRTRENRLQPTSWASSCDILQWFDNILPASSTPRARGNKSLIILIIWSLWNERNSRVFQRGCKTIQQVSAEILDTTKLWITAGSKHLALLVGSHPCE